MSNLTLRMGQGGEPVRRWIAPSRSCSGYIGSSTSSVRTP